MKWDRLVCFGLGAIAALQCRDILAGVQVGLSLWVLVFTLIQFGCMVAGKDK